MKILGVGEKEERRERNEKRECVKRAGECELSDVCVHRKVAPQSPHTMQVCKFRKFRMFRMFQKFHKLARPHALHLQETSKHI
jgi:hypothetical protein